MIVILIKIYSLLGIGFLCLKKDSDNVGCIENFQLGC